MPREISVDEMTQCATVSGRVKRVLKKTTTSAQRCSAQHTHLANSSNVSHRCVDSGLLLCRLRLQLRSLCRVTLSLRERNLMVPRCATMLRIQQAAEKGGRCARRQIGSCNNSGKLTYRQQRFAELEEHVRHGMVGQGLTLRAEIVGGAVSARIRYALDGGHVTACTLPAMRHRCLTV